MEFFLTRFPESFLGKVEGVLFFLMFVSAVYILHQMHRREDRIYKTEKVSSRKPKK
jgi:hypothetical protein